jgi:outer membrane biosynthesis protein TonB
MAGTGGKFDSLRLNRFEGERLTLALLLSLALHLLAWGGYEANKKFDFWQRIYPHAKKVAPQVQPLAQNSDPQIFMDVTQPSPDAPDKAKYYSDKNSRASSKETGDSNVPKLNGPQTDFMKLENALRSKNSTAQPPPESQLAKNEAQSQPKPVLSLGDLSRGQPQDSPEQKNNPEPPRPRTLKEAMAQQQSLRPSVQAQVAGGTRRQALVPSLDTKATPFGDYDRRFIDAVQDRWDNLLDSHGYAQDRTGEVTVRFHLNYDGRITDMEILQNTVGDLLSLLCQDAISDQSPFEAWPSDMRREIGANFREITFTFYYY